MSAEPNVRFNSVTSEFPPTNHEIHSGYISFIDARGHKQTRPLATVTVSQCDGTQLTYTAYNARTEFAGKLFHLMDKPAEHPIVIAHVKCVDKSGIPEVLGFPWLESPTPGKGYFHIGSEILGKLVAFTCLPETDFVLETAPAQILAA